MIRIVANVNKDYYSILGVAEEATSDEIKKAYRKLAIMYHPDKTKGDKELEAKFKEATEAYQILSNEQTRKQYDEARKGNYDPNSSYSTSQGTGFDNFVDEFIITPDIDSKKDPFAAEFGTKDSKKPNLKLNIKVTKAYNGGLVNKDIKLNGKVYSVSSVVPPLAKDEDILPFDKNVDKYIQNNYNAIEIKLIDDVKNNFYYYKGDILIPTILKPDTPQKIKVTFPDKDTETITIPENQYKKAQTTGMSFFRVNCDKEGIGEGKIRVVGYIGNGFLPSKKEKPVKLTNSLLISLNKGKSNSNADLYNNNIKHFASNKNRFINSFMRRYYTSTMNYKLEV